MIISVNDRLRMVRKESSYTQQGIADLLNVNKAYYSDLENNKRPITDKFLNKFCSKLSVNSEWLKTGKGNQYTNEKATFSFTRKSNYSGGENAMIRAIGDIAGEFYKEGMSQDEFYKKLLNRAEKLENKALYYHLKSTNDISKEYPQYKGVLSLAGDVVAKFDTLKIIIGYIERELELEIKYTDYDSYKKGRAEILETLLQYKPIMQKMDKFFNQVIKDFKPFDTFNKLEKESNE